MIVEKYKEMEEMRPAVKTDFGTSPMPSNSIAISASMTLSAEQMQKVRFGLVPKSMDDRWFVFYEDSHLFISRSWQHIMFYRADFEETGDGGGTLHTIIVNAEVAPDAEKRPGSHRKQVQSIIEKLLLNDRHNRHDPWEI